MIVRIWRTRVDPKRAAEYERFAQEQSLPMFKSQDGFLGVLFTRSGVDRVVASFWIDEAAVARLGDSASYHQTVARIEAAGFLIGSSSVEALTVHGGFLAPEMLTKLA